MKKSGNKKMSIPRQEVTDNPIPTSGLLTECEERTGLLTEYEERMHKDNK